MIIYEILPGLLYQSGALETTGWEAIQRRGIRAVIDLEGSIDPDVPGNLEYTYWPIDDGPVPDTTILIALAHLGAELLTEKRPLLVHCALGINRSSLLNALIIHFYRRVDGAEAIKTVRAGRPGALTNRAFEEYVLHFTSLTEVNNG